MSFLIQKQIPPFERNVASNAFYYAFFVPDMNGAITGTVSTPQGLPAGRNEVRFWEKIAVSRRESDMLRVWKSSSLKLKNHAQVSLIGLFFQLVGSSTLV